MRRWLYIILSLLAVAGGVVGFVALRERRRQQQAVALHKPEAPPDLERLRSTYTAAVDAIHRGDGAAAVRTLSSFSFGKRAVEEYRLYYLANGHQLLNDRARARATLAQLWFRAPKLIVWVSSTGTIHWIPVGALNVSSPTTRYQVGGNW